MVLVMEVVQPRDGRNETVWRKRVGLRRAKQAEKHLRKAREAFVHGGTKVLRWVILPGRRKG